MLTGVRSCQTSWFEGTSTDAWLTLRSCLRCGGAPSTVSLVYRRRCWLWFLLTPPARNYCRCLTIFRRSQDCRCIVGSSLLRICSMSLDFVPSDSAAFLRFASAHCSGCSGYVSLGHRTLRQSYACLCRIPPMETLRDWEWLASVTICSHGESISRHHSELGCSLRELCPDLVCTMLCSLYFRRVTLASALRLTLQFGGWRWWNRSWKVIQTGVNCCNHFHFWDHSMPLVLEH